MLTGIRHRKTFRKAIYAICGTDHPSLACLADIGARAAKIARRGKPWTGRHVYVCFNLSDYIHHNNGRVKYGIHESLFSAVMRLAGSESMRGKRAVKVYARSVREGAVVFGNSRKCAWRRCRVHFVSDTRRIYCSESCGHEAAKEQRRECAGRRRAQLKKRRQMQRAYRARRG